MKKIFTIALFAVSLSANAFWGNNNGPWSNGYNNNNYGYQQDNGIVRYFTYCQFFSNKKARKSRLFY
jgi:hypothetical protein